MAEQKSSEERIAELDKRIEQIKAQKKAIIQREKQAERKARTKRLIEICGAAESVLGRPFQLLKGDEQFYRQVTSEKNFPVDPS